MFECWSGSCFHFTLGVEHFYQNYIKYLYQSDKSILFIQFDRGLLKSIRERCLLPIFKGKVVVIFTSREMRPLALFYANVSHEDVIVLDIAATFEKNSFLFYEYFSRAQSFKKSVSGLTLKEMFILDSYLNGEDVYSIPKLMGLDKKTIYHYKSTIAYKFDVRKLEHLLMLY